MCNWKKAFLRLALCLSLLFALALSGCHIALSPFWTDVNYSDESSYTIGGGVVREEIKALEIHWPMGEINVLYHDGDGVEISEQAKNLDEKEGEVENDLLLRYKAERGNLTVQFAKNGRWNFRNVKKDLTISLPQGTKLNALTIYSVSSPILLDGTTADKINIDTVSGDVRSKAMIAADSIAIDCVSANAALDVGAMVNKMDFNSVSGNLTLKLAPNATYSVDFDTVSGVLTKGEPNAVSSLCCRITANTVSGCVTIETTK